MTAVRRLDGLVVRCLIRMRETRVLFPIEAQNFFRVTYHHKFDLLSHKQLRWDCSPPIWEILALTLLNRHHDVRIHSTAVYEGA